MAFLLLKADEVRLTDFNDLRASYAKFVGARDEYWEDLGQKVSAIADGFYAHISPVEQYYFDTDKRKKPYVESGIYELGKFSPANIGDLSREDGGLGFAFKVTLDESPDSFPKDRVVLEMLIKRESGKYIVSSHSNDGGRGFRYSGNLNGASQKELYELMAGEILSAIDPGRFA